MKLPKSIDHAKVYGILGLLLGTLPAASIFVTFAIEMIYRHIAVNGVFSAGMLVPPLFMIGINLICSFAGTGMGLAVGMLMKQMRSSSQWSLPVLIAPIGGLIWGIITGGSGGLPFIIIGAFAGALFAAPVGVIGFTIFAAVYEPLCRQRSFSYWQIALLSLGIALFLAFIMLAIVLKNMH